MTPQEWSQCLAALADVFGRSCHLVPRSGASQEEIDGAVRASRTWFGLLQDLPDGICLRAVAEVCRGTRAFPSVADIREAAEAMRTPEPSSVPPVEAAWAAACRWVDDAAVGPTYVAGLILQPPQPHPAVAAAVGAVGREAMLHRGKNCDTMRAQFRRAYEALAEKEQIRASAGLASLLAPQQEPQLLLTAGTDDPAELERQNAEARRLAADAFRQQAEQRQQERAARTQEVPGLRREDGRLDVAVLRQALGVRPAPARRGPIQGVEPEVDEARREAARQRLAQRRDGAAC